MTGVQSLVQMDTFQKLVSVSNSPLIESFIDANIFFTLDDTNLTGTLISEILGLIHLGACYSILISSPNLTPFVTFQ